MLHIDALNIKNFRNHSDTHLGFKKGVNVIWGENGSGKTAVLEAIYSLSMGRSFRTRNHKETLKEAGASFDTQAKPLIIEIEGQTLRLTGTAKEKFLEWRKLLKQIYTEETGFNISENLDPQG